MLEKCHKFKPKPKTTDELKTTLQTIWEELPQEHINRAVANFTKRCYCFVIKAEKDWRDRRPQVAVQR